jgi:hypothetical protein
MAQSQKVRANSFTYCLGRYWQRYAARKSRLEGVLELCRRLHVLDHDAAEKFRSRSFKSIRHILSILEPAVISASFAHVLCTYTQHFLTWCRAHCVTLTSIFRVFYTYL